FRGNGRNPVPSTGPGLSPHRPVRLSEPPYAAPSAAETFGERLRGEFRSRSGAISHQPMALCKPSRGLLLPIIAFHNFTHSAWMVPMILAHASAAVNGRPCGL